MNPQHLDHAVRTGLISAALIGTSIGILYGLTHSVQIGTALTDAIGIYADSSGVTFNTGSPLIASMVSIIPALIGGVARGRGAYRCTNPGTVAAAWPCCATVGWGLVIAIAGGGAAGAMITAIVPQFAAQGAALGGRSWNGSGHRIVQFLSVTNRYMK